MGAATDYYNKAKKLTREEQDEYAAMSHERATAAGKNGLFEDEIVKVEVPQRRGDPLLVSEDEGVRAGHHRPEPGEAPSGVRRRRHGHRGLGLARSPTAPPRSSS